MDDISYRIPLMIERAKSYAATAALYAAVAVALVGMGAAI